MRALVSTRSFVQLFCMAVLMAAVSQAIADTVDVRSVRWGMSEAQVGTAETARFTGRAGSNLGYEDALAGIGFRLSYHFIDGALVALTYSRVDSLRRAAALLADYQRLKTLLYRKYGASVSDRTEWSDESHHVPNADWAEALRNGWISRRASWKTPRTRIETALRNVAGKDLLQVISYESVEHQPLIRSEQELLRAERERKRKLDRDEAVKRERETLNKL